MTRIIFFGTPNFAVPALHRLNDHPLIEIAMVVTQPDRPVGRGRRPRSSPVKQAAERLRLDVYQPARLKSSDEREVLASLEPDIFIVAAFGQIFDPKLLALPRLGSLNLHASLLPKYRGASPVTAAILGGDERTGVSLMRMETGLDTGPVLATIATDIPADATADSLTDRLADLGADLLIDTLPRYINGTVPEVPQPNTGVSLTRPLTKSDGELDWTAPAEQLERQVRAMWPWPRAWTTVQETILQVHEAEVVDVDGRHQPGDLLLGMAGVVVQCGSGALRLNVVQAAGRRSMSGDAFRAGLRGRPARFTLTARDAG